MKGGCDVFVQLDVQSLLQGQLLVPFFYLFSDPVGEDVLEDRSAHIADPFPAHLVEFPAVRQVAADLVGVQLAKLLDLFQRQGLVVGHGDVLGVLRQDL